MAKKRRKAMVRWTDGEVKKLSKMTAEILLDNPGLTLMIAINQAQEDFKEDRRRVITGVVNLPEGMYDKIKVNMRGEREPVVKVVKCETMIPADIKEIETDKMMIELVKRIMLPAINQTGQIMSANVIKTLQNEFRDVREMMKGKPPKVDDLSNKLITVLVIGLLPEQGNEVEKALKGLLKLTFMKDPPARQLRAKSANQDHTILITKFISHSVQEIVKKADAKIIMCHGGLTDLKAILEDIYLEGQG